MIDYGMGININTSWVPFLTLPYVLIIKYYRSREEKREEIF
jgi:hypothetical protein